MFHQGRGNCVDAPAFAGAGFARARLRERAKTERLGGEFFRKRDSIRRREAPAAFCTDRRGDCGDTPRYRRRYVGAAHRACSTFSRLMSHASAAKVHSPAASVSPHRLTRRQPMTYLMMPNTDQKSDRLLAAGNSGTSGDHPPHPATLARDAIAQVAKRCTTIENLAAIRAAMTRARTVRNCAAAPHRSSRPPPQVKPPKGARKSRPLTFLLQCMARWVDGGGC